MTPTGPRTVVPDQALLDAALPLGQAALEGARLRLRPILMTSFAFIMGVIPLVFSSGAGFEMRRVLGITVFSGMLGGFAGDVALTFGAQGGVYIAGGIAPRMAVTPARQLDSGSQGA